MDAINLKELVKANVLSGGEEITFKSEKGILTENGSIEFQSKEYSFTAFTQEIASKKGLHLDYINLWKEVFVRGKPLEELHNDSLEGPKNEETKKRRRRSTHDSNRKKRAGFEDVLQFNCPNQVKKKPVCTNMVCLLCLVGSPKYFKENPPTWSDILQVVLFTLSKGHPEQPFFALSTDIYPFVEAHFGILECEKLSINWKQTIKMTLSHARYSHYFENGYEVYLKTGYWRLRPTINPYGSSYGEIEAVLSKHRSKMDTSLKCTSQQASPDVPVTSLLGSNLTPKESFLDCKMFHPRKYDLSQKQIASTFEGSLVKTASPPKIASYSFPPVKDAGGMKKVGQDPLGVSPKGTLGQLPKSWDAGLTENGAKSGFSRVGGNYEGRLVEEIFSEDEMRSLDELLSSKASSKDLEAVLEENRRLREALEKERTCKGKSKIAFQKKISECYETKEKLAALQGSFDQLLNQYNLIESELKTKTTNLAFQNQKLQNQVNELLFHGNNNTIISHQENNINNFMIPQKDYPQAFSHKSHHQHTPETPDSSDLYQKPPRDPNPINNMWDKFFSINTTPTQQTDSTPSPSTPTLSSSSQNSFWRIVT